MTAMIQNDQEKEWMTPLLELRNALDFRNSGGEEDTSDRHLRDFRRMSGSIQLFHDRPIPGPYTQEARERWLKKLLEAQTWIRTHGPANVRSIELISLEELQEIRRMWVVEKHEMEDNLPRIYQEATGEPFDGQRFDDNLVLGEGELKLLREICGDDRLHYELTRELLSVERQQRSHARRSGLFEQLEKSFRRHYFDNKEDATNMARRFAAARATADLGGPSPVLESAEDKSAGKQALLP
jgi:DNA sulfur modification protein DndC